MRLLAAALLCLLGASLSAADQAVADAPWAARPDGWAAPLLAPGLPNLHRVSAILYRSAQPDAGGMRAAEALGIRTVISLRAFHDDEDLLDGTALREERISFKTWHPETEDAVRFLALVSDPANQPVLVHCQHGADRTGMMCALYRMAVEGWSADQAIQEMVQGGYGFHPLWGNLVRYLRDVDIDALRAAAVHAR